MGFSFRLRREGRVECQNSTRDPSVNNLEVFRLRFFPTNIVTYLNSRKFDDFHKGNWMKLGDSVKKNLLKRHNHPHHPTVLTTSARLLFARFEAKKEAEKQKAIAEGREVPEEEEEKMFLFFFGDFLFYRVLYGF